MFRKQFFIDFFYKHILDIDMVNDAIKALIANNGGNKKIIAGKLGITPQFLGQLERGERQKPSAELVAKIKEVYGVDILTGRSISEAVVSQGDVITLPREVWDELRNNNKYFMVTNDSFRQEAERLWGLVNTLMGRLSHPSGAKQG